MGKISSSVKSKIERNENGVIGAVSFNSNYQITAEHPLAKGIWEEDRFKDVKEYLAERHPDILMDHREVPEFYKCDKCKSDDMESIRSRRLLLMDDVEYYPCKRCRDDIREFIRLNK